MDAQDAQGNAVLVTGTTQTVSRLAVTEEWAHYSVWDACGRDGQVGITPTTCSDRLPS